MKRHLLGCLFLIGCTYLTAQTAVYDFEANTLPSQLSTTASSLSLDKNHRRSGVQALKWTVTPNATLSMDMGALCNYYRVIYLPIYCLHPSDARLELRFYQDAAKTQLAYSSEMCLNYYGWREFQKFIPLDFSTTPQTAPYRVLEITYRSNESATQDLWLDDVNLAAPYSTPYSIRIPGIHMKADYEKGLISQKENLEYTYLQAYMRQPDAIQPITDKEKSDYTLVADAFRINNTYINNGGSALSAAKAYLTTAKCSEAINYVNSLKIQTNPDGSLNGTPFSRSLYIMPSALVNLSYQVLALSYGAQTNQDATAKEKLLLFTRYLLDQGIAAGGRVYVPTNSYAISRHFILGFLHAMPIYQHEDPLLAKDVIELLRWTYTFGYVYDQYTPALTSDFIYVKSRYLFALADFQSTIEESVRDIRSIEKFYEQVVAPIDGANDLIKPDGTGFHHGAMHNSYMYVFQNWIQDLYKLRNTCFALTRKGYEDASRFIVPHFLQCATNASESYYANSLCGRGPFVNSNKVGLTNWQRLIEMGGRTEGKAFDPEMGALYNYVTGTLTYQGVSPVQADGFYQLNYGNLGFVRKNGWVATMRGFTSQLWGTEIYSNANRYGRFQSYGALEILYNQSDILAASGYPLSTQPTWDWNAVPGTTHVHTAYNHLNPSADRADEVQQLDFAGALSFGQNGLFGMEFEEDPTNYWATSGNRYMASKLAFKKSYFVCDSMIVALGSNISASPAYVGDFMATNLFQEISRPNSAQSLINRQSFQAGEVKLDLSKMDYQILTGCGTGYFLPKQPGTLTLFNGEQQTPLGNHATTATPTYVTSEAVKGWIQHNSRNSSYEYVVLPNCTTEMLQQSQATLGNGKGVYSILKQDEEAHVLRFDQHHLYGYAVFFEYSTEEGPIRYISAPSLVMAREDSNQIELAVCDPTLNRKKDASYGWISAPFQIEIVVAGIWYPTDAGINYSHQEQHTRLSIQLCQGKAQKVLLKKASTGIGNMTIKSPLCYRIKNKLYLQKDFKTLSVYSFKGTLLQQHQQLKASQQIEIPNERILIQGITTEGDPVHLKL